MKHILKSDMAKGAERLRAWKSPLFDEDRIKRAHDKYLREKAETAEKAGNLGYVVVGRKK